MPTVLSSVWYLQFIIVSTQCAKTKQLHIVLTILTTTVKQKYIFVQLEIFMFHYDGTLIKLMKLHYLSIY